jgi:aminopeptidase N
MSATPAARRTRIFAGLAALALLCAGQGPASAADGVGDPYFPKAGNPGYDVRHYAVGVRYRPTTGLLTGTTTLRLRAKKRLTRFNLDLLLDARAVTVEGRRARFSQTRHELTVRPSRVVRRGRVVDVRVRYQGKPRRIRYGGETPFVRTRTGAIVVGQPQAAAWWFPSNDHPSDKARFDIALTVPRGYQAISNGALTSRRRHEGLTTFRWSARSPMATYLAFAAFGRYDLRRGVTASGRHYLYAFEHRLGGAGDAARRSVRKTGRVTDWLERTWGRYPFGQIGGVVPAVNLGFALENQTRPVYGKDMFAFGPWTSVVVHEMAHQWFGDKVAIRRWQHIWLNEGFATYSEWLWTHARGGRSPQREFLTTYRSFERSNPFWDLRIGDPGPRRLFDDAVYVRGAMTLQALRNRIGRHDFFTVARRWVHRNAVGLGSTRELKRLAERVSGRQLDRLFRNWLFSGEKPAPTRVNGF